MRVFYINHTLGGAYKFSRMAKNRGVSKTHAAKGP